MVRLELEIVIWAISRCWFQFHKGTFRTIGLTLPGTTQVHFNSIKVRLELQLNFFFSYPFPQFQFHKGTIRTICAMRLEILVVNFNSIKVRLEHLIHILWWMVVVHFNSIKVRLELIYALGLIGSALFQFHKGTIRTCYAQG